MIWRILGFGILAALTAFLLSELGFRGKRVYSVLALSLMLLYFIDVFGGVISELVSLGSEGSAELMKTAVKIIGVGYAFSFASDVCDELSEGSISKMLSLICRAEILMIALPCIREIIDYARDLASKI